MQNNNIKIVTVGGGSGGFVIDRGLSHYFDNIVSITTSFDSGGSSGVLRDEFGVLPQGDIRRRILAQSHSDTVILRELFSYRFEEEKSSLNDHSLGNLILTAATKIWGEQEGIDTIAKLFGVTGRVLPVTFGKSDLQITLSDGGTITGETQIDTRDIFDKRSIEHIKLTEKAFINNDVKESLVSADYIILCPGDFYTSLIPNIITSGFTDALIESKAKILYFPNFMTKASETAGYSLVKFVTVLESYLKRNVDYIFVDTKKIKQSTALKYAKEENAEQVCFDMEDDVRVRIVELHNTNQDIIRHDSDLCAQAVLNHIYKKVLIWDLDDTVFFSPSIEDIGNQIESIRCYENIIDILKNVSYEHYLVTAYTYGNPDIQNKKIDTLGIRSYFKEIYICKNKEDKEEIFTKIIINSDTSLANTYIIGDRHDGELLYGKKLGTKTVCVALKNCKYLDKKKHDQYDYIIENEDEFAILKSL